MRFTQDSIAQEGWIQDADEIVELVFEKTHEPFALYDLAIAMQEFDVARSWFDSFRLPNFDLSKAIRSDEEELSFGVLKSGCRDANLVQTSSAVFAKALLEADKHKKFVDAMRTEIFICLNQAIRTVNAHRNYLVTLRIVMTETGRIFLAGELNLRQLEAETKGKEALFNLRIIEYGCVVMASIMPGKTWVQKIAGKNDKGKAIGVVGWGLSGATTGMYFGPYGAAIGAVVGIIIGIAIEFL